MAASDLLPVDPDYAVVRAVKMNVIETRSDGGKVYRRMKAAPQRVFAFTWLRRSLADMKSIRDFLLNRKDDFFTFVDKSDGLRNFSVFAGDLQTEEVGNEQHNCRVEAVEAIGKPLSTYPTTPLSDNLSGTAQSVSTGKVITYGGYGFTVTFGAGLTALLIDGVSQGAPASPYSNYSQALNVHRVELRPNTVGITNFQAVI